MTTPTAGTASSLGSPAEGHGLTDKTPEDPAVDSASTAELAQATMSEQAADDTAATGWPPISPLSRTDGEQVPAEEVAGNVHLVGQSAPVAEARRAVPHAEVRAGVNFGMMIGQYIQAAVRIHRGQPLPTDWVDEQLAAYVPPCNEDAAAAKLYGSLCWFLLRTTSAADGGQRH